jgi:type II restriction enzyme
MRYIPAYNSLLGCRNDDEVFKYLIDHLTDTIKYWDYFVNWSKVLGNYEHMELELHMLDYLVGKNEVRAALADLLRQQPKVIRLIPVLLAIRGSKVKLLTGSIESEDPYETFDFTSSTKLSEEDIEKACEFASMTGLLELFHSKRVTSVTDYVLGVEVGLDSNGRKNRSGTSMEKLVKGLIATICHANAYEFLPQATAMLIKQEWDMEVRVDKSSRDFDFAINANGILYLVETNYYSGGGSKLKATAGEYRTLHATLSSDGHRFIWITDGQGWKTVSRPLREAFNDLDYILNIKMVLSGVLQEILSNQY